MSKSNQLPPGFTLKIDSHVCERHAITSQWEPMYDTGRVTVLAQFREILCDPLVRTIVCDIEQILIDCARLPLRLCTNDRLFRSCSRESMS